MSKEEKRITELVRRRMKKPLDGASGIRRGKRARGRAIFRLDVKPNHKQIHGVFTVEFWGARGYHSGDRGLYGNTQGTRSLPWS